MVRTPRTERPPDPAHRPPLGEGCPVHGPLRAPRFWAQPRPAVGLQDLVLLWPPAPLPAGGGPCPGCAGMREPARTLDSPQPPSLQQIRCCVTRTGGFILSSFLQGPPLCRRTHDGGATGAGAGWEVKTDPSLLLHLSRDPLPSDGPITKPAPPGPHLHTQWSYDGVRWVGPLPCAGGEVCCLTVWGGSS